MDFQFKVIAKQTYSGEGELAAFFGYFYGFTGIIASLVQFFLTRRLLEKSGIVVALCILPVTILLGAFALGLPQRHEASRGVHGPKRRGIVIRLRRGRVR